MLLPNTVKPFARSTEPKSKTDQQHLLAHPLKAPDQDLADLLQAEPGRARNPGQLTSIPGIGLTAALVVVAEPNGFGQVENERQPAPYAGLDVVPRQSGPSSAQAPRIARRGNGRLRTARSLPAVSRLRHTPQQLACYARLRIMPACGPASPAASRA